MANHPRFAVMICVSLMSIALVSCGVRDTLGQFELKDGWTVTVIGEASYDDVAVSLVVVAANDGERLQLRSSVLGTIDLSVYESRYLARRVLFGMYQDEGGDAVAVFDARDPSTILAIVDLECGVIYPSHKSDEQHRACIQEAVERIQRVVGRNDLVAAGDLSSVLGETF